MILDEESGTYDPNTGRIQLANGLIADYDQEIIQDYQKGTIVWSAEQYTCTEKLSSIFHGPALLFKRRGNKKTSTAEINDIILVDNELTNQFGGFIIKTNVKHCNAQVGYQTCH